MHASFFLFACLLLILSQPTSSDRKVNRAAFAFVVDNRNFSLDYHTSRRAALASFKEYFMFDGHKNSIIMFSQMTNDNFKVVPSLINDADQYKLYIGWWKVGNITSPMELRDLIEPARIELNGTKGMFKVMVIFVKSVSDEIYKVAKGELEMCKLAGIYVHVVCIDTCYGSYTLSYNYIESMATDLNNMTRVDSKDMSGPSIWKQLNNILTDKMCKDVADTCSFTSDERDKCVKDQYRPWWTNGSVSGCPGTAATSTECDIHQCKVFCEKWWPREKHRKCTNATDPANAERPEMPEPVRILENCEKKCNGPTITKSPRHASIGSPPSTDAGKCEEGSDGCNKCEKDCKGPWYKWWYMHGILFMVPLVYITVKSIWYQWDPSITIFTIGWPQWVLCKYNKMQQQKKNQKKCQKL